MGSPYGVLQSAARVEVPFPELPSPEWDCRAIPAFLPVFGRSLGSGYGEGDWRFGFSIFLVGGATVFHDEELCV